MGKAKKAASKNTAKPARKKMSSRPKELCDSCKEGITAEDFLRIPGKVWHYDCAPRQWRRHFFTKDT